jgi:hypothetical protein
LLELGTGFNPQLTGVQNIFNSARLLGFPEDYVRSRLRAIVDFAELGDFIDRPIHIYSSGMYVRLAFSLFACLEPDVYVIDEALAVGDSAFQRKCVERIQEMRRAGVTILYVSHDLWRVEALCSKAIYLDGGRVRAQGLPAAVVQCYLEAIEKKSPPRHSPGDAGARPSPGDLDQEPPGILPAQFDMYVDSPLRVRRLWTSGSGRQVQASFERRENFEVVMEYECTQSIRQPVFRVVFSLPDERRVAVIGWHPGEDHDLQPGLGMIRWRVEGGILYPRKYVLHASISAWDGVVYDTQYGIAAIQITARDLGPIFRATDDLAACLDYTARHER